MIHSDTCKHLPPSENERDSLLNDLESKDEMIEELEMTLQQIKDKEDNSADADLQRGSLENFKLMLISMWQIVDS